MENILEIQNKYKDAFSDNIIPYKYILEVITKYTRDIKIIAEIILTEKDEEALTMCEEVKNNLSTKLNFLRTKLEAPNLKYLDESDEEFVDKYM